MSVKRSKINGDQITVLVTGLLFLIFGIFVLLASVPDIIVNNTIAIICGWLFIIAGAAMLLFVGYWIFSDLADDRNVRQGKDGTKPSDK